MRWYAGILLARWWALPTGLLALLAAHTDSLPLPPAVAACAVCVAGYVCHPLVVQLLWRARRLRAGDLSTDTMVRIATTGGGRLAACVGCGLPFGVRRVFLTDRALEVLTPREAVAIGLREDFQTRATLAALRAMMLLVTIYIFGEIVIHIMHGELPAPRLVAAFACVVLARTLLPSPRRIRVAADVAVAKLDSGPQALFRTLRKFAREPGSLPAEGEIATIEKAIGSYVGPRPETRVEAEIIRPITPYGKMVFRSDRLEFHSRNEGKARHIPYERLVEAEVRRVPGAGLVIIAAADDPEAMRVMTHPVDADRIRPIIESIRPQLLARSTPCLYALSASAKLAGLFLFVFGAVSFLATGLLPFLAGLALSAVRHVSDLLLAALCVALAGGIAMWTRACLKPIAAWSDVFVVATIGCCGAAALALLAKYVAYRKVGGVSRTPVPLCLSFVALALTAIATAGRLYFARQWNLSFVDQRYLGYLLTELSLLHVVVSGAFFGFVYGVRAVLRSASSRAAMAALLLNAVALALSVAWALQAHRHRMLYGPPIQRNMKDTVRVAQRTPYQSPLIRLDNRGRMAILVCCSDTNARARP